jgi:lysophospholipase L1-like esterase
LTSLPDTGVCRLGVLAFGDSITNGGGELQWGVALQSWALWVARGLGLPFTSFATDGATVCDVVSRQVPEARRRSPSPDAQYDLGCIYIGVNDVRRFDWDAARFEEGFGQAVGFLRRRCRRVLVLTAPLDLGRPRAGAKVADLNFRIERVAAELGALVLDLSDFGARNLVMTDHVHPTALGQIVIAERALNVLASDGVEAVVRPSSLVHYEPTWWHRLRADVTYAYRHAKVSATSLALVGYFRLRPPRSLSPRPRGRCARSAPPGRRRGGTAVPCPPPHAGS